MKVWVVVEETRNLSSTILGVFSSLEGADEHRQHCFTFYGRRPKEVFFSVQEFELDGAFAPNHWKAKGIL